MFLRLKTLDKKSIWIKCHTFLILHLFILKANDTDFPFMLVIESLFLNNLKEKKTASLKKKIKKL